MTELTKVPDGVDVAWNPDPEFTGWMISGFADVPIYQLDIDEVNAIIDLINRIAEAKLIQTSLEDAVARRDKGIADLRKHIAGQDERIAELASFKDRVIGWREFDHPEYFCRATAEWIATNAKEDKS